MNAPAKAENLQAKLAPWFETPRHFDPRKPRRAYRTVFISDTHLGTKGCNADMLLDFLRSIDCETLYLVGDIVDGWQLRKGWYWPPRHNDVVRCVLKQAKHGTQVIFVPGNHDEVFRDYVGLEFGGVSVRAEDIHHTADGRKLLIVHGDEFDGVVRYAKWLAFLGDHAYTFLLKLNRLNAAIRKKLNLPYWSLSAALKMKVKNAVSYICDYENAVARAAAERGVDGVVCGHIHHAEIKQIGDITYYNDGDWVESCTALVEHADGTMEIVDWGAEKREQAAREKQLEMAL